MGCCSASRILNTADCHCSATHILLGGMQCNQNSTCWNAEVELLTIQTRAVYTAPEPKFLFAMAFDYDFCASDCHGYSSSSRSSSVPWDADFSSAIGNRVSSAGHSLPVQLRDVPRHGSSAALHLTFYIPLVELRVPAAKATNTRPARVAMADAKGSQPMGRALETCQAGKHST